MTKRLLISYAHPDDESFGNGALIAKYVAEGAEVYYICATNGDVGTIPDDMKDLYPTVAELRLSELACASEVLGFKKVFTFGYRDSGMMGAETNQHPDSLWYHGENNEETLVARVVDVIREVRPHVILTFNEYGGYGHPDHIAIQRATTKAFSLAADASYQTDLSPYQSQKLYYGGIPGIFLRVMVGWLKLRGHDVRHMGTNKDIDLQAILDHIDPYHTKVDIGAYYDKWDESSVCHQSQGGGGGGITRRFPSWFRRRFMNYQQFTRVVPAPSRKRVDEYDLFVGIKED